MGARGGTNYPPPPASKAGYLHPNLTIVNAHSLPVVLPR